MIRLLLNKQKIYKSRTNPNKNHLVQQHQIHTSSLFIRRDSCTLVFVYERFLTVRFGGNVRVTSTARASGLAVRPLDGIHKDNDCIFMQPRAI